MMFIENLKKMCHDRSSISIRCSDYSPAAPVKILEDLENGGKMTANPNWEERLDGFKFSSNTVL